MIAFKIREVKHFMSGLFQKSDFDDFLVREAEVQTVCNYKINGHRNHRFYSEEELGELPDRDYLRWEEIKLLVFQMIRGTKTPQLFSVVLLVRENEIAELLAVSGAGIRREDIAGAYMNLKFQAGELTVVTGVGFRTFVQDKIFERTWDQYVRDFLKEKEILFDEL